MKINIGETYTRKNKRGRPKSRTVTRVSGTSIFWRPANGTRIRKSQRDAFEYWLHHGTSMYHNDVKQKDIEENYLATEFKKGESRTKRVRSALRMGNIRHKVHDGKVWIHKDDYQRSKNFLFGVRYGGDPKRLQDIIQEQNK